MSSNKTIQSWDWDVRVRARNLKQGRLTDQDVDKHLGKLPDMEAQSEPVSIPQPALGGRDAS